MLDLAKVGVVEEQRFAHQKMLEFELRSRRLKHLGTWAAAQMRMGADQAASYVHRVLGISVASASDETVVQAIHDDFVRYGVARDKQAIRAALAHITAGAPGKISLDEPSGRLAA